MRDACFLKFSYRPLREITLRLVGQFAVNPARELSKLCEPNMKCERDNA